MQEKRQSKEIQPPKSQWEEQECPKNAFREAGLFYEKIVMEGNNVW